MAQLTKYLSTKILASVFIQLVLGASTSCHQLSNTHQSRIMECGDLAGVAGLQLYRIADAKAVNAEVWDVDSATLTWHRLQVNEKGCFGSVSQEAGHLIIRSRSEQSPSGTVITKEQGDDIRVISMTDLKLSDQIPDICPEKTIHVSKNSLDWPVNLGSQDGRDFFFVVVPDEQNNKVRASLLKSGESSPMTLALSGLTNGTNELKFALYDLIRSDRKLSEQTCQFVVDTIQPNLSVKDSRNQELTESVRVFAPGEKIFVATNEPAQVQYCISELGNTERPACTTLRSDSSLDLPRSGRWTLQFQAEDYSGNIETRRYAIEVFDQNAVDLIKERARVSLAGASLNQAQHILELEESRQKLEGSREQAEAEPATRVAMLSAMLSTQEIRRFPQKCEGSSKAIQVGPIVLTVNSSGLLCAYRESGEFLYKRDLDTLSAFGLDNFKIYQDRFIIYSYGTDPHDRNQLRIFDSLEGIDKQIAIEEMSAYIDDFDINPANGTIHVLTKSESPEGNDSYLEVSIDGKVNFRKELNNGRYSYVSYLPLPQSPKIVLGYSIYVSSRERKFPELCDPGLVTCERRADSTPDFKEVFVNREGNLLATNFKGKTLLWALHDSTDLALALAKESPGSFIQFLDQQNSFVTRGTNAYMVDSMNQIHGSSSIYGSLETSVNFIFDRNSNQTILMNQNGFERWRSKKPFASTTAADEKAAIRDAMVLHGSLVTEGTELTVFTTQYVARYQLAYSNLNPYHLFADGKSGIMASRSRGLLTYSNAGGVVKNFASQGSEDSVLISPRKKYALLQTRAFEGKNLQLINAAGETIAGAQGEAINLTLADTDADETRLLYSLDHTDFILFDSSKADNVQYFSFESFGIDDTMLLPKLPSQVIVIQEGVVKLVDVNDRHEKVIASQAEAVQTGKQFPFITYIENSTVAVLKNLVTGAELRWVNAAVASIEEACHSIFIEQSDTKLLTILDLRNFESHAYPGGTARCLQPSGQLVVESSTADSTSLLLDSDYQVLASLPSFASWISANQQGILVRRNLAGREFLSYSFQGELLGKQEFELSHSEVSHIGSTKVGLDHYFILALRSNPTGVNPNQTTYKFYDVRLKLVASSILYEGLNSVSQLELVGPLIWNHATNQFHEITHPATQEKFLPVPQRDGIRFYPLDNLKLYKVLSQWIDAMKGV